MTQYNDICFTETDAPNEVSLISNIVQVIVSQHNNLIKMDEIPTLLWDIVKNNSKQELQIDKHISEEPSATKKAEIQWP